MYVCFCAAVTDRAVRQAIADGATTVEGVAARCLAGSRCGSCRPTVEALLGAPAVGRGQENVDKEGPVPGDPGVIEFLNEVLTAELTAVNQYFLDAEMFSHWGYGRLAERFRADSIDEMKDAEALIKRVLFLGGLPNVQRLGPVSTGETPAEKLRLALGLERAAIERLNRGLALCLERSDGGSRQLLEAILHGEEEHADWLDAQLELVRQMGEPNYLSQQVR